jgi:hypothetical protein
MICTHENEAPMTTELLTDIERDETIDSDSDDGETGGPSAHLDLIRATPPSKTVQIFVSYRVVPDQRIASALKRLIETSIEPLPNVFVSGAGGLRPSNTGAIPQMQAAAENAAAFVGVITHSSKAREWIFFEAGAAWGRRRLLESSDNGSVGASPARKCPDGTTCAPVHQTRAVTRPSRNFR